MFTAAAVQANAAPPRTVMNSRRFGSNCMQFPTPSRGPHCRISNCRRSVSG
jgi:hypothetical protein